MVPAQGTTGIATAKAIRVELSDSERAELQARLRRLKVARGDALRAEIVMLAAVWLSDLAITELEAAINAYIDAHTADQGRSLDKER